MLSVGKNGFHLTFNNGWTASVQFGRGNYCNNRDAHPNDCHECKNAEVAAWRGKEWHNFSTDEDRIADNVKGWLDAHDVLDFLNLVAAKEGRS